MVCSRSGVPLYAATPRSGPGLLCAAARFESAMYVTVLILSRICRPQEYPLSAGRVRVHNLFRVLEQKGIYAVLKNNLSLLEGLEFTPPSSARTKGDDTRYYVYTYLVRIPTSSF